MSMSSSQGMGSRFCCWKTSWKRYPRGKKPRILNGQIFKICQINKKICSAKGVAGWADGWEYKQVDLVRGNLVTLRALKMIITLFMEISIMEAEI